MGETNWLLGLYHTCVVLIAVDVQPGMMVETLIDAGEWNYISQDRKHHTNLMKTGTSERFYI